MPVYVYQCEEKHETEVAHGFTDKVLVFCPECHKPMHRVPQAFRWYFNPQDVLLDKLDKKYREYRSRKNGRTINR